MKISLPRGSILLYLTFLIWVTLVIAFYYVVHKPWGIGQPYGFSKAVLDTLIAITLVSLAGGLGNTLLKKLISLAPLENIAVSMAVGIGILSLGVLFAGMLGWLYSWVAWIALAVGLFALRKGVFEWLRQWSELVKHEPGLGRFEILTAGFSLLLIVINFPRALAPPVKWDSLVYHLELPRQYLAIGRILFLPENFYAGFPQLAEMLFTWAMRLSSATTAATLGFLVGVVALIGVEGFTRRFTAPGARFLAPAILLSGFSISQSLSWAYVDFWMLLFGLGLFIFLEQYRIDGKPSNIYLAGAMAGFAIGVKYTAGILLLVGSFELLIIDIQSRNKQQWRDILCLGLIAFLFVAPWLVKNWILTGNPAYPFISFPSVLSPWRQGFRSGPMPERSIVNDLLLPIDVILFGIESSVVVGKPEYGASLGPLLLALIPGLFVGRRSFTEAQWTRLKIMVAEAILVWIIWAGLSHIADELMRPRHYFGIFPILVVLATAGFQAASSMVILRVRFRRVLVAMVGLALFLTCLTELYYLAYHNPIKVVFGAQSEKEYLHQELGAYSEIIEEINTLPENSTILFLWEPRIYYCKPSCIMDAKLDNWWAIRQAAASTGDIARLLHERGISYVLVYEWGLRLARDLRIIDEVAIQSLDVFRQEWLQPYQAIGNNYKLYKLKAMPNSSALSRLKAKFETGIILP